MVRKLGSDEIREVVTKVGKYIQNSKIVIGLQLASPKVDTPSKEVIGRIL